VPFGFLLEIIICSYRGQLFSPRSTLRLTAVNLISSQVGGAELNRGKSASSDQTEAIEFSFSFPFFIRYLLHFIACASPKFHAH
jgi:hypothetical protein